ncbi:unnamed protein product, partial [marine sediment metagenome]
LQKPAGRNEAYGKGWTAFDPALYVSIDKEGSYKTLKFVRIKTPKPFEQDPYSLTIQFKISQGVNFFDEHKVYGDA